MDWTAIASSLGSSLATWWITRKYSKPRLSATFELDLKMPLYASDMRLTEKDFEEQMHSIDVTNRQLSPSVVVRNPSGNTVEISKIQVQVRGRKPLKITDRSYGSKALPTRMDQYSSLSCELSFSDFVAVLGPDTAQWPDLEIRVLTVAHRDIRVRKVWKKATLASAFDVLQSLQQGRPPQLARLRKRAIIL